MRIVFFLLMPMCCAAEAGAQEVTWPQEITGKSGTTVLIYQPQIELIAGNSLEARAAVSVKAAASGNVPIFGAIWIEARLEADRDVRSAVLYDIEVSDVRFVDVTDEQRDVLVGLIETSLEGASIPIAVDQLLADMDAQGLRLEEAELRHDPPIIILSTEPAMLITIDGEPVLEDIEGSRFKRVVNTPFLIVKDGRAHYLYTGSDTWYLSRDIPGPWSFASSVPADVRALVESADASNDGPGDLEIVVATEPTELLVSDGEPSWAPVKGVNLLYMDNTDSDAFLEVSTQRYYVLLSGRWYRSEGMSGDLAWVHVPNDELPEPFSAIPADSVNEAVLSQVAGTQQARDAVLDNTIPQTAAINRDDVSFSVSYDGDPDFAPIEDIQIEYAQNTSAAVFKYGNLYYACDDGAWYVANSPTGTWAVATEVPDAVYRIPASNPHHNVTYVRVYDVTPEAVYVGYTPGYFGSYYYHGAVVYGTGWYYSPWYGPYYYPRYPTWGFRVHYNPWTGWNYGVSWGRGPFRFTFGTSPGWWGVGGYRPRPSPYVRTGYRKTNINPNSENNINSGDGGKRPETGSNLYDRPGNRERNADQPSSLSTRQARPAENAQNNVLTDRSGNVYLRETDGNWSQRNNGRWQQAGNLDRATTRESSPDRIGTADADRAVTGYRSGPSNTQPSYSRQYSTGIHSTRPQLERDYASRQYGVQRSQTYQQRRQPRRP